MAFARSAIPAQIVKLQLGSSIRPWQSSKRALCTFCRGGDEWPNTLARGDTACHRWYSTHALALHHRQISTSQGKHSRERTRKHDENTTHTSNVAPAKVLLESNAVAGESTSIPTSPSFLQRIAGVPGSAHPPAPPTREIALSVIGAFAGLGMTSAIYFGIFGQQQWCMILGSFGATTILLFCAPAVPFSQPRNVVGGHVLSAAIGVAVQQLVFQPLATPWAAGVAGPLAVALAGGVMMATKTVHPPAGGTALTAATALAITPIGALGPLYIATTVVGSVTLVGTALLVNNMLPGRRYPQFWR